MDAESRRLFETPCGRWEKRVIRASDYNLSSFLRNRRVRFMSFLYLCFFIFSFLCLLTLIKSMPLRLLRTCSRKVFERPVWVVGRLISRASSVANGSKGTGAGGGLKEWISRD